MRDSFSLRNGYEPYPLLKIDGLTDRCNNRLWNRLHNIFSEMADDCECVFSALNYILDCIGEEVIKYPAQNRIGMQKIEMYWKQGWYRAFEVLESFLSYACSAESELYENGSSYTQAFNKILEEENSGFRFSRDKVQKISNDAEMQTLSEAKNTGYKTVDTPLQSAIDNYSACPPKYENAIKDSITAVESMCRIIVDDEVNTLTKALDKLKKHGVNIDNHLIDGFKQLYRYTCDAGCIRHGDVVYANANDSDAKYMLVTCSAFINYLKSKIPEMDGVE